MADSIMQSRRECYITGDTQGLNRHHVYGGGRRQAAVYMGLLGMAALGLAHRRRIQRTPKPRF